MNKLVNGKYYPLWQQFVDKKDRFIGGTLEDHDMGMTASTTVTDVRLEPNGEDSACFEIDGEDFGCGFDVRYGGIGTGEPGWLTFHGYGSHWFRVKTKDKALIDNF